jgi:acyl carrier protein
MEDEILARVTRIVAGVLDQDDLELHEETVARDVPGWDSLSNVQILLAVEKHFGVRFTSREIQGLKDVGELCARLRDKQKDRTR